MPDVNLLAVLGSAIVVFVIGFTYYAAFGMPAAGLKRYSWASVDRS